MGFRIGVGSGVGPFRAGVSTGVRIPKTRRTTRSRRVTSSPSTSGRTRLPATATKAELQDEAIEIGVRLLTTWPQLMGVPEDDVAAAIRDGRLGDLSKKRLRAYLREHGDTKANLEAYLAALHGGVALPEMRSVRIQPAGQRKAPAPSATTWKQDREQEKQQAREQAQEQADRQAGERADRLTREQADRRDYFMRQAVEKTVQLIQLKSAPSGLNEQSFEARFGSMNLESKAVGMIEDFMAKHGTELTTLNNYVGWVEGEIRVARRERQVTPVPEGGGMWE